MYPLFGLCWLFAGATRTSCYVGHKNISLPLSTHFPPCAFSRLLASFSFHPIRYRKLYVRLEGCQIGFNFNKLHFIVVIKVKSNLK